MSSVVRDEDEVAVGERQHSAGNTETVQDTATLVLAVSEIGYYEHNPRHSANPAYARIKASIRAHGLDQPLIVTQRPGAGDYIVFAGGNTRLKILKELYAESGQQRFSEVTCLYRPWTHETDVLLAHLRENDIRGDLTFIDKASAILEMKHLVEQEGGEGTLTQTRLAEVLSARGYALSQGLISQMAYAVERLLPLLPTALHSGMGRPQVERIRQLERATRRLWLDRAVDTEDEFEQAFDALCRRYDDPEWDLMNLRRALEAEIAERAEVSIHAVSMVLEGYLTGRRGLEAGREWRTETEDEEPGLVSIDTEHVPAKKTTKPTSGTPSDSIADDTPFTAVDQSVSSESGGDRASLSSEGGNQTAPEKDATETPADDGAQPGSAVPKPTDLKSLRARAWTLASRLAQRNGLSELVQPLSAKGLGFLLRDVPDPALVDQLDEETLAQVSMVWWYLAAAAEMTVAPLEYLLPGFHDESVLRRALEDQDAGLLFSSVWTLDPGHMGFRLWRRLDERDWRDLVDLMATYRAIHRASEASGKPLWQ